MAIDFPATPSNGQTFTSGSVTYTYDGTKWTAVAAGGGSLSPGSARQLLQTNAAGTATEWTSDVDVQGTFAVKGTPYPSAGSLSNRNKIINGDMRIDQRNDGAAITSNGGFPVDRWKAYYAGGGVYSGQRSTTTPAGFVNSLLLTVTTADSSIAATDNYLIRHNVEGFNVDDLAWGTASAKSVTLSFWVRSSVTGTYGGSLTNHAENRSYPFSYTISAADTFEYKTITIPGETTGTWLTNNSRGVVVHFALGMGSTYSGTAGAWASTLYFSSTGATNWIATNGATFYLTGVQLEVGEVATPFEHRSYGDELARCQRYYYKAQATGASSSWGMGYVQTTTQARFIQKFPVEMRDEPTALEQSGTAGDYRVYHQFTSTTCSSVPTYFYADTWEAQTNFIVSSGLTVGDGAIARAVNSNAYLAWSAEL
jgi:hypothetical protein